MGTGHKIITAVLLATVACAVSGCGVDPAKANRALTSMGMTDVKLTGWAWYGCSDSDDFGSNFEAKDAHGQVVTGVVCGGWLKGYTVRFD